MQKTINQIVARLRASVLEAFTVEEVRGPVAVYFLRQLPLKFNSVHDKDKWAFSPSTGALSHLRAGHYSISVLPDDIAICKEYTSMGDNSIQPGSKFWELHKRDRLSQLQTAKEILQQFPDHPLRKVVLQDIAIERADLFRS